MFLLHEFFFGFLVFPSSIVLLESFYVFLLANCIFFNYVKSCAILLVQQRVGDKCP